MHKCKLLGLHLENELFFEFRCVYIYEKKKEKKNEEYRAYAYTLKVEINHNNSRLETHTDDDLIERIEFKLFGCFLFVLVDYE